MLIYSLSMFGDVEDLGDVVGFGDVVGDCVFIYSGSIVVGDFGEGGGFDTLDLDDIGGSFVCENKFTTSAYGILSSSLVSRNSSIICISSVKRKCFARS